MMKQQRNNALYVVIRVSVRVSSAVIPSVNPASTEGLLLISGAPIVFIGI